MDTGSTGRPMTLKLPLLATSKIYCINAKPDSRLGAVS
ncbi:hypothetical protein FOXG_20029 [Fusarium oxysporum f. sp. lycopersici 4287]|uniref:Uncharacterized protein n=2 Tax=Fusarium oxysporum TaxID=5507 RepID=A0A0J9VBB8_FUSO4|nr:hypothetical protein FOXG_20029 [Fusarium oxysporum f. sp. lycopersici 4287]EXK37373.1 hypothetical protein FOMG_08145 [Fusarium oxysporum f. sp. melonis 26406]KNB08433.1 hypothetical protein FOXG_20029 [Fusarium oxysporum f. sp. lycopersici 4287]